MAIFQVRTGFSRSSKGMIVISPSRAALTCSWIFMFPGCALFLFMGGTLVQRNSLAAIALFVFAGGIALLLIDASTMRAELNPTEIRRISILHRKALAVPTLVSAMYFTYRGARTLVIRSSNGHVSFSYLSFSNAQLDQIRDFAVTAASQLGRSIQTALPPPSARSVQIGIAIWISTVFL